MKHGLFFISILFSFAFAQAETSLLEIKVPLNPAGSFTAQSAKIKGAAYRKGDLVTAENVLIDLKSLSTGINLRDKHLKERLLVTKYPVAKLIKAQGKDGKGKATIEIKGKKQEVAGTYKVNGNQLVAEFKVKLPDLDITDVRYMGVGVADEVTVQISLPVKSGSPRGTASE